MFKTFRKNVKKRFREYIIRMVDGIAKYTTKVPENASKTLLVLRHDAIGDYLLFRPYLPYLKQNHEKLVLVGNTLWKTLATELDSQYIDHFIWIDTAKFRKSIRYRYQKVKEMIQYAHYDTVLYPIHSREYQVEHALTAVTATHKIALDSPPPKYGAWQWRAMNTQYKQLLKSSEMSLFEGYKNQQVLQTWLQQEVPLQKTTFSIPNNALIHSLVHTPYIVLFPGASTHKKRWKTEYFATIAQWLHQHYPQYNLVVAGSSGDTHYAQEIIAAAQLPKDTILDYTGKTSLIELAYLIQQATLLISNDTSAVHFAAATQTKFVCMVMGEDKGKFLPYPEALGVQATCLFAIDETGEYDIQKITPEKVWQTIKTYLN